MVGERFITFKNALKIMLPLVVFSLYGNMAEDGAGKSVRDDLKPVIAKEKSYSKGATIEPIVFYSQKMADSSDVIVRHGVLKTIKDAPATVLVCHGYMCDKNDIAFLRSMFMNYNVMTFDFRAHGERKEDQYCTFGRDEALDVIGAVRYLRSRSEVADKPIIAYGFSMGAASAIEAQSRDKLFDAMILDCPFDSTDSIIKRALANFKFNVLGYQFELPGREWMQEHAYTPFVQALLKVAFKAIVNLDAFAINTYMHQTSPVESIEKVNVPCYFITCKNDQKVPVDAVTSVYAGAKGYKRLWITNGRRHYDSLFFNPEKYFYKVNKFVAKVVAGTLKDDVTAKITQDPDIAQQL
jgi:pimeloyl-ACP methyl ester carboxylesterase